MSAEHAHKAAFKDTLKAIAANGSIAVAELVIGSTHSSQALLADCTHNVGDVGAYALNAKRPRKPERAVLIRRIARTAVCAGALAVASHAISELPHESEPVRVEVPAIAAAAVVASRFVHNKLHVHREISGSHADNADHALADKLCSPVALGFSVLALAGVPHADEVGSIIVSGATIWLNRPTNRAMNI